MTVTHLLPCVADRIGARRARIRYNCDRASRADVLRKHHGLPMGLVMHNACGLQAMRMRPLDGLTIHRFAAAHFTAGCAQDNRNILLFFPSGLRQRFLRRPKEKLGRALQALLLASILQWSRQVLRQSHFAPGLNPLPGNIELANRIESDPAGAKAGRIHFPALP